MDKKVYIYIYVVDLRALNDSPLSPYHPRDPLRKLARRDRWRQTCEIAMLPFSYTGV